MPNTFDLVLTGGLLLSGDGSACAPGDLGVAGGRITRLAGAGDLREAPAGRTIDLRGRLVLPGFWDSHLHLLDGALALTELQLRDCADPAGFARALRRTAGERPGRMICGRGWEEGRVLPPGRMPDRRALDELRVGEAVALFKLDGHSAWLNTRALEEFGVDSWDYPPARLPRGADGYPAGLLYEEAVQELQRRIDERRSSAETRSAVQRFARLLAAAGVTAINDIAASRHDCALWRSMQEEGTLPQLVYAGRAGDESVGDRDPGVDVFTGRLRPGPDKYFLDGSFGSRTAMLYEPYADRPDQRGLPVYTDGEAAEIAARAVREGRQLAWHAIGDRALGQALAAYEKICPVTALRHRLEHLQIVRPNDIARFVRLGLIASFQPVFLYEQELALACLGAGRLADTYRIGSFRRAGAAVLLNTDWPYGGAAYPAGYRGFEPLLGIHAACALHPVPAERLAIHEAVRAYTSAPAWANFAEGSAGRLEEGFAADLAVLDRDILSRPAGEILEARVDLTVAGGRVVYERP